MIMNVRKNIIIRTDKILVVKYSLTGTVIIIKAIIQKKYGVISKEHNLVKLLEVLYLQGYPELKKYKSVCRDLKDFYFSRRYASDDYEILTHEEYIDYINNFYELLNKLKRIRSEFE